MPVTNPATRRIAIIGFSVCASASSSNLARRRFLHHLRKKPPSAQSMPGARTLTRPPRATCRRFPYCFSFEHKTDWSRKKAPQAENPSPSTWKDCAKKYDLMLQIFPAPGAPEAGASWDRGRRGLANPHVLRAKRSLPTCWWRASGS